MGKLAIIVLRLIPQAEDMPDKELEEEIRDQLLEAESLGWLQDVEKVTVSDEVKP